MRPWERFRATMLPYLGAVAAVFIAWLIRLSIGPSLEDHSLYVTFVGAVLITTWLSGLGPGLFALVLSVFGVLYFFLPLKHSFHIMNPLHAVGLAIFVVVTAICIGVTEALRAMHEARGAALRLSDERFRHLTEAVPSMVWTAAPDGSITYANGKWLEFTGAAKDREAQGWPALETHPDDLARCTEAWQRSIRDATEYAIEVRHRRHDGVYRWFMTRAVPWKNPAGAVITWFGITTDIHEQKEMQERLHEADRRKDEFLATLAHELRNPLAPLRNALEIMRRSSERGLPIDHARAMMERQLSHLVRLVDDLLDLSRITRGRIELRLARIEVGAAVSDAVETCRSAIEARAHRLTVEIPREPLFVDADRVRLAQVFTNLISNATKYSPRGGDIAVRAWRDGETAVVSVRDRGMGIGPDLLPHVFDMFSQAMRSQELSEGGLGIGLSLVRGLVEQHGGTVVAKSDGPGRGSEFVVRLPVACEASSVAPRPERRVAATAPRRRVLVADDNRDAADSLVTMLSLMGHDAHAAYDGPEAIAMAAEHHPDVIVLDVGMPRMDGYETARRIRSEPWSGGVLLVALTGWGQEEDRHRAKRAGFDHHLTKPASPEALVNLLAGAPSTA